MDTKINLSLNQNEAFLLAYLIGNSAGRLPDSIYNQLIDQLGEDFRNNDNDCPNHVVMSFTEKVPFYLCFNEEFNRFVDRYLKTDKDQRDDLEVPSEAHPILGRL